MLAFGIGCAIGGILGGFLGQKTYNYSPRMLPLFIGGCQASSVLPLWFLLHNDVIADDVDDSFHIIAVSVVTAFITGARLQLECPPWQCCRCTLRCSYTQAS